MEKADCIALCIVGTEGIGADKFRESVAVMGVGAPHRSHFVQDDLCTQIRRLPGSLGTRQPATDDMKTLIAHATEIKRKLEACNRGMKNAR